ncbi:MAG: hypothetical protein FWC14_04585 [Candidatus Bathyarchaeota archaeon]|uniref:hypothetical protein n=2 Tax=Candidatus Bathycorpusculum sp. TaxID=2994959 RepID=UPI00281C46D6|nr:hypothetical protein [Candidatus Termiticorpusculum sp.]
MVTMEQININSELLKLYELFLEKYSKTVYKTKKSKNIDIKKDETRIILELIKMNGNTRSKVFSSSALWLNPANSEALLEKGLIQSICCEHDEKYALSLTGIATCIQLNSSISFEQQYKDFLILSDKKFNKTEDTQLDWREKLATVSLILLASTSEQTAIRLVNNQNKTVLLDVLQEVLSCMKKYRFAEEADMLKSVGRGEDIAAGHFARLDTLPRRTNHHYYGKDYVYYINIETNHNIDNEKLSFIFKRCFSNFNETSDFIEMYEDLSKISQKYSHRFLHRKIEPRSTIIILNKLKEFLQTEIFQLSPQKKS